MTSKDKLIYTDKLIQINCKDSIDYSVITSNIEDILKDLEKLEKLEKIIEIIKDNSFNVNILYNSKNYVSYCNMIAGFYDKLTNEEYDLLKEVLEDE